MKTTLYIFSLLAGTLLLFSQCDNCINRELEEAKFNDISIEKAVKKLGKESSSTNFILDNNLAEHRRGLLTHMVVNKLENATVKEYTWNISECRKTHIWFIQKGDEWLSISNLTYNPQKVNY